MTVERTVVWVTAAVVVAVALGAPRVPTPTDDLVLWLLVAVVLAPLAYVASGWLTTS